MIIMNKNSYRYTALHLMESGIIDRSVSYPEGVFSERLTRNPELVICGAGHVSQALCEAASRIGFAVTVIDERPELTTKERFPSAQKIICNSYTETLENLENKCVFFAVMTPGHVKDLECVRKILDFSYLYLGMIGSHKKVAHTREVLQQEGFSQEKIDSLHAPIGLAIGAQTPEEIAISICGQLIQERAALKCSYLDEEVYRALLSYKERMSVATIIEKTGSAPRGVGSCIAVRPDGTFYGTVGGGSVENAVINEACSIKKDAAPFVKEYNLTNSAASDLGMICGGTVKVLFEDADL